MGPDHPHIEAYHASKHGVVYQATHDEKQAPTCATCHMPKGVHDVSSGITIGRAGSGAVLKGETPPIPMKILDPETVAVERAHMLERCQKCHTPRFAREALEDADAIKREADRLVAEAARIVRGLFRDRLLDPMPDERFAHPTAGHALVLGGGALYENHSEAERIFFDLAKFAHAITFKGAYHFSPDHTHWLGNARLKASLEELRAEERRLRQQR
jgi:hydroxylamine dehydrogenase